MASLNEIEAEIALLPLLSGEIRINEVVLRGGQVVIETNKDGVGNWVLDLAPQPAPAPEDSATTASGLPKIDRMTIEDVTLLHRDGETGEQHTLAIKRFTAEDAPGAGIKVEIKGAWNERPLELAGTVGAPRQFTEGPLPLNLQGKLGEVALGLRGQIGDPTTFSDLSLDVTSSGPSLAALGEIFGIELPNSAPYSLETRVNGGGGKFTFADVTAKVGGSDAAGNIVLDTASEVTGLTMTLASQRLDFKDLGLDDGGGTSASNSDGRLFSAEPWPLDWLKHIEGEFTWPIGTLVRGGASAQRRGIRAGDQERRGDAEIRQGTDRRRHHRRQGIAEARQEQPGAGAEAGRQGHPVRAAAQHDGSRGRAHGRPPQHEHGRERPGHLLARADGRAQRQGLVRDRRRPRAECFRAPACCPTCSAC